MDSRTRHTVRMDTETEHAAREDLRRDRRTLVGGTTLVLVAILLLNVVHNVVVAEIMGESLPPELWLRIPGNLVVVTSMPVLLMAFGAYRPTGAWAALRVIVPAAVLASLARALTLWLAGAWTQDPAAVWVAEWVGGVCICVCAALLGFFSLRSQRLLRAEERRSGERALQRELALQTLETEEIRVRRSIAEGLHGSLQQRLVIQSVRLKLMIDQARDLDVDAGLVEGMQDLRADIDRVRERDLREMSRVLYPEGIEIGMVPAMRMLVRRLPPGIAATLDVSDEVRAVDDPASSRMSQSARLLAVRCVEEAVTNGLRHGHATAFVVTVGLVGGTLRVEVANDGADIDVEQAAGGTGLRRLRERLALVGGRVDLLPGEPLPEGDRGLARAAHGVRLRADLPLGDQRPAVPVEVITWSGSIDGVGER